MKKRFISAGIIGLFLIFNLYFYKTVILNITISILAGVAVYELLLATKYINNRLLAGACLAFASMIPFFKIRYFSRLMIPVGIIFVFVLFMIMITHYKTVKIEEIGLAFFISIVVPFAFSSLVYLRDKFIDIKYLSMFYILMSLSSAWTSDSGAYLIGTFLGKTPLIPEISPKKTVEGLFGGIISSTVVGFLFSLIFSYFFYKSGMSLKIHYFRLLIILPLASIMGVLGDLSASLIKRQCSIKDFGEIIPGHGGILDRFDSVLFVVPFYYLIEIFFPLVK